MKDSKWFLILALLACAGIIIYASRADLRSMIQRAKEKRTGKDAKREIAVKVSYSIEDRFFKHGYVKPAIFPEGPGTVMIDITVDNFGDVTSTNVNSASTITDEAVLDACRKAALKTGFNFAHDRGNSSTQTGTIIYTFNYNQIHREIP